MINFTLPTSRKYYVILILFLNSISLSATDYFVDAVSGNDNNNGLSTFSAFRSIRKIASTTLRPGDNVFFMDGTYTRPGNVLWNITESGTENNYITIQNLPGHSPVLEFDSWSGLNLINGASYIKISGLKIKGANSRITLEEALNQPGGCAQNMSGNAQDLYNGVGILAVGPNLNWSDPATNGDEVPSHIIVENCEVFDCPSSGMAFQQADYVTLKNNKVFNNCWYSIYGTSGINLYQFINTDNTTGVHNVIENNLLYGNSMFVPQLPSCLFLDGNALIVDDFNHTQVRNYRNQNITYPSYTATTSIFNNISVDNGGSGLHFFLSSNLNVYNNTVVNNASQNEGVNGNADLRIGSCSNINIINNILIGEDRLHAIGGNTNLVYRNNYEVGPGINATVGAEACSTCISEDLIFENNDISVSQPFITVDESIIIDRGLSIPSITTDFFGNVRPQGLTFDIGAYEFDSTCQTAECLNQSPIVITLIDADNDIALFDLSDGATIDLNTINNVPLSIIANSDLGSVRNLSFELSGVLSINRTESVAPYALFGDNPGPDYNGQEFEIGDYSLTVTVNNTDDTQTTRIINFNVVNTFEGNLAPRAVLSSNVTEGFAPFEVIFTGSNSTDDEGIVSYLWDFGDGTNSNESDPSHSYTQPGTYTATLTVTDSENLMDSGTVSITVLEDTNTSDVVITLIDAENDTAIINLEDNSTINLNAINNAPLSIIATSDLSRIRNVNFELSGALTVNRRESAAPYAIFGDNPGLDYNGRQFPAGNYALTVRINFTNNSQSIRTINFSIIDGTDLINIAPVITLISPNTNAIFTEGESVSIEYDATDEDGTIAKVEFYLNNNLVSTSTTAPYIFNTVPNVGENTLFAIAFDDLDSTTTSETSTFNVEEIEEDVPNIAPVITLISPNTNAIFTEGESVSIEYDATDEDGTIAKVEFYLNNNLVSTSTTAPYMFNTVPNVGENTLFAIAFDDLDSTTTSDTTTFNVEEIEEDAPNIAPVITLISPNTNAIFTEGESVSIEYDATDEDGTIAKVEFYLNNSLVSTSTTAPYIFNTVPNVGENTLFAIAFDDLDSTTTSDTTTFNVEEIEEDVPNIAPVITLISPNTNAIFTEGESVSIEYDATDEDGTIAKVEFYLNNSLVSTSTTAPYIFNTVPNVGENTLFAIAFDDLDSTTTSDTTTFNVEEIEEDAPNIAPVITLISPNTNAIFTEGESVSIEYDATDEDGTIAKVEFYLNNSLVSTNTTAPYIFTTVPNVGENTLFAIAFDDLDSTTTSDTTTFNVENVEDNSEVCEFAEPRIAPLQTIDNAYNFVHVFGENAPTLDNIRRFTINWNLENNGLYTFAFNTNNGQPSYWVNLRTGATQRLNSSNPSVVINNSGITGLDGDYFVSIHNDNFVLISKSSDAVLYFSNSEIAPLCNASNLSKIVDAKLSENKSFNTVTLFPNPALDYLNITMSFTSSAKITVYSIDGRLISETIFEKNNGSVTNQLPVYNMTNGTYIVKIDPDNDAAPIFKYFVKN